MKTAIAESANDVSAIVERVFCDARSQDDADALIGAFVVSLAAVGVTARGLVDGDRAGPVGSVGRVIFIAPGEVTVHDWCFTFTGIPRSP